MAGQQADINLLVSPLPEVLAARIGGRKMSAHRKLGARAVEARRAVTVAQQALAETAQADFDAAARAALEGKPIPPSTVPAREQDLAQAERERGALETAVTASADRLLGDALPQLEQAIASAEQELDDANARQADLIAEAISAGEIAAELQGQVAWIRALSLQPERLHVRPYTRGAIRPTPAQNLLRQAQAAQAEDVARAERYWQQARDARRAEDELVERQADAIAAGRRPSGQPTRVRTTDFGSGIGVERIEPDS